MHLNNVDTHSVLWYHWCGWFGNGDEGVGHINNVNLREDRFVLRFATTFGRSTILVSPWPTHPGHPFVAVSAVDCFGHHREEMASSA